MSEEVTKFCRDCNYYRYIPELEGISYGDFGYKIGALPELNICDQHINLVTGNTAPIDCENNRSLQGFCGISAKFFQPKKEAP